MLDLFAGVGSFGIECLSRGARNVTFVENYSSVLKILRNNLKNLKSIDNFHIIEKNIYDQNIFSNFKNNFDIIFLDPPYKDKEIFKVLKKIKDEKILNNKGIIIIHRHKKEKKILYNDLKIIEEKTYGISKIIFLSFLN